MIQNINQDVHALNNILLVTSFNFRLETKLYKWVSEIKPKAKAMRHFNVEVVLNFDEKVSELFMSQCDNMFNIIIQWPIKMWSRKTSIRLNSSY